jgi:hypothetical protein
VFAAGSWLPPFPASVASRSYKRSDRELDCQAAPEPAFQALAGKAEHDEWSGDEAAGALLALAITHIKARIGPAAVS